MCNNHAMYMRVCVMFVYVGVDYETFDLLYIDTMYQSQQCCIIISEEIELVIIIRKTSR